MGARASAGALAALMGGAGVLHVVVPEPYAGIVPPVLGDPYVWVYASGVAELACAAGLAWPRTRRPAALATAALLVVVFPANVQMVLDSGGASAAYQLAVWGRLPLQVPLVLWALSVARGAREPAVSP